MRAKRRDALQGSRRVGKTQLIVEFGAGISRPISAVPAGRATGRSAERSGLHRRRPEASPRTPPWALPLDPSKGRAFAIHPFGSETDPPASWPRVMPSCYGPVAWPRVMAGEGRPPTASLLPTATSWVAEPSPAMTRESSSVRVRQTFEDLVSGSRLLARSGRKLSIRIRARDGAKRTSIPDAVDLFRPTPDRGHDHFQKCRDCYSVASQSAFIISDQQGRRSPN
jgi:hypothetical protein